jgi:hypothetical protein
MKIKDIRQYRTFYKNDIRDLPNRDEHFIGTFYNDGQGKKTFGWFEIYHGDRDGYGKAEEGIGNYLSTFLDMAKDGQAVYEFLQNAVDAGSSHFTMVWGKDEVDGHNYVLIANNGEMFDFNNVRSILNVGSSTKLADSQNIGKFGIGFKLAHRLVGKVNGLEELLSSNPSGPILFSWQNAELGQLASASSPEPQKIHFEHISQGKYKITDINPWLFKILVTCFPALPGNGINSEKIRLSDGSIAISPVFDISEYHTLCRWVKKYRDILNDDLYKRGALFFIKLGAGKENDLADYNLAEGVKFSIAILQETSEEKTRLKQTLQTVQFNREPPITKPNLNYHFFYISKEKNLGEYVYIRFGVNDVNLLSKEQKVKLQKEADIEVLFGFRNYNKIGDYFKGAPNFYLYFPLSEEVHNFNFVLHSNAFYKAASRTFLHKGSIGEDGINERLLQTIAQRLEYELISLYKSDNPKDKEKFLHLYAALLTSNESSNFDRKWVREPFVKEVTKVLKKVVPVRTDNETPDFLLSSIQPRVKKTSIEIPLEAWGIHDLKWFYWGPEAPGIIRDRAIEKLEPMIFDVFTLMQRPNVYTHINQWIERDKTRISTILNELNLINLEKVRLESFKNNLKNIRFFEFNDGTLLSDNELVEKQNEGYIVLHNQLKSVETELQKIGIKTSIINLDDFEFYRLYSPYLSPDTQLRSQAKLIELVSKANIEILNPSEKLKIFKVFRDMIEEGRRGERLEELKLFKNQIGKCVKLKNILRNTEIFWLQAFQIHKSEQDTDIDRYLLRDESMIYENIVFKFWDIIANNFLRQTQIERNIIIAQITKYYNLTELSRSEEKQLIEKESIFFNGEFRKVESPFYHDNLIKIIRPEYSLIQKLVNEKLSLQIPDYDLLTIYQNSPFKINTLKWNFDGDLLGLNLSEAIHLLIFCKTCDINIFKSYTVFENNNSTFDFKENEGGNYFTENNKLKAYINKYFDQTIILLPESLKNFSGLISLKGSSLNEKIIKESTNKGEIQIIDLLEALLNEDEETLLNFFSQLKYITLNANWQNERANLTLLKLIKRLSSSEEIDIKDIQNKIVIIDNQDRYFLNSIDSANDEVELVYRKNTIKLSRAQILGLKDEGTINKVLEFVNEVRKRQILTEKELKTIFKVESSGVTQELIELFFNNLEDSQLENSHQLALVLLSDQIDRDTISELHVLDGFEVWQEFSGNWLFPEIQPIDVYNRQYVLSEKYTDLSTLIRLQENEMLYYGSQELDSSERSDYLIPCFMFKPGCNPAVLNSEQDITVLFDYLLTQFKSTPKELRTSLSNEDWESIVGFDPNGKIYSEYLIKDELLKEEIINWTRVNESERIQLLTAIGINTNNSDIAKIRNWFMADSNDLNAPVAISQIPNIFLSKTLIGLAEGFENIGKNNPIWNFNSKQHQLINQIISQLLEADDDNLELRFPVWSSEGKIMLGKEKNALPKYLDEYDYLNLITNSDGNIKTNLFSSFQIIVPNECYNDFIKSTYEEQEIKYYFVQPDKFDEHDEPFYKSWSRTNKIKLNRVHSIDSEVNAKEKDDYYITIGIISGDDYFITEEADFQYIYYKSTLSLEMLFSSLIDNEESDIADLLKDLISDRDKMLAAFYHTLTSSGRDDLDNEDTKLILESLKERSRTEERVEIINDISSNEKYSYDWFESYIRYLLSFEELADTTTQKSISFQKIEPYFIEGKISEKYFMLQGANSMIPLNIESFEDFSINLVFKGGVKENIIVEGVSKKGQDLLTFIPQGIKQNLKTNFHQVVSININFSPVLDLIQRLYDAFTNEDIIDQWDNINKTLQPLKFIYGPPGTGKTTKICKILENLYPDKPTFKALVLVPTNKAGDVLAKKLIKNKAALSIIRIGKATDPELESLDDEIYKTSVNEFEFDNANVIISTVHRFPYYQVSREHGAHFTLYSQEIDWDLVIFDESSMIALPYIVFALMSLMNGTTKTSFIIAGDPKQIPPIVDTSDKNLENLDMDDESIYKMLGINSFSKTEQEKVKRKFDIIENLTDQYRSTETIGRLFSSFSYENLLGHERNYKENPVKLLPESFIKDLKSPVTLINFPISLDTSVLQPRKLLYSSYHVYAGIFASEIIKYLDKCNELKQEYSIGIISPYKAQSMLMSKLIVSSGISTEIQVKSDTVHGFQGDECDIIIFVINPNNTYYSGHKNSLLSKEYVYNVAISRARDYLWILNPFNDITNNPYTNLIQEILDKNCKIVQSKHIERIIFKDPDFIVKNSYLTGHDNINVFGQVDMKYFIKAGNSAIDIQLRK